MEREVEEINLKQLILIIWKGKWWVVLISVLFTLLSTMYSLYLPNEYRATAVVKPNNLSSNGGVAPLSGKFGGLVSLAGINLGTNETSDTVVAMEIMGSWGFVENLIKKYNLTRSLNALENWSSSSRSLIDNKPQLEKDNSHSKTNYDDSLEQATSWQLYKNFERQISIHKSRDTGLISISATHFSPHVAKKWVDIMIKEINLYMKERALDESNQRIEYLEQQINQTSVAEIRNVFSELIQEQHKTKMLAQVSKEYVFKTITEAKVPEERVSPKRFLIIISGFLLGLILSIFIVLLRFSSLHTFEEKKSATQ